ncbi:hypothetical protein SDC9_49217 [bioreactor metagenome]|uniref:SLH domain-containing protein n=1 Tax=bioreactor metagenome TaxID=1076179 RepID=A0A644WHH6_9ZZZZ
MLKNRILSLVLIFSICIAWLPTQAFANTASGSITEKYKSVALGDRFAAAITKSGNLYTWGSNDYGQLGLGDHAYRAGPTKVEGLSNVVCVSLGETMGAAVTSKGDLYTWGHGGPELGLGNTGHFYHDTPEKVNLTGVKSAVVGPGGYCAAVTCDGNLYVWGNNDKRRLGLGSTADKYTPTKITGIPSISSVDLASDFAVAVTSSGGSIVWGDNTNGQLGIYYTHNIDTVTLPQSPLFDLAGRDILVSSDTSTVCTGEDFTLFLSAAGHVSADGLNDHGQLGRRNSTVTKGGIKYPLDNVDNTGCLSYITDIVSLSCGNAHGAAVTLDGKLYTWGRNDHGQLGLGTETTEDQFIPQEVKGLPAISSVSCGYDHTAVVTKGGEIYVCGADFNEIAGIHSADRFGFVPVNSVFRFPSNEAYQEGQFSDVNASDWYSGSVSAACNFGLMKGIGGGAFGASGSVAIAEAVALASRIHMIYETGTDGFTQSIPWYQAYADYALENVIIPSPYPDYTKTATRAEFAAILANALPDCALGIVNTVDDGMIPDIPEGASYYSAVYKLYRAGILTGNDADGTFTPENGISRSAAAAIAARMADPGLRKPVTLRKEIPGETLSLNFSSVTLCKGIKIDLTASFLPADTTKQSVFWQTSDPSVVSVSGGTVTAADEGTATVTATGADGVSASCDVTVAAAPESPSLVLCPSACTVEAGAVFTITPVFTPPDTNNMVINWKSANYNTPNYVDRNRYFVIELKKGSVTAIAPGTAAVTATAAASGNLTATCIVTVIESCSAAKEG